MKKIILSFVYLVYTMHSVAQTKIIPGDAPSHVGDSVSVSGIIYGGHDFENFPGRPSILVLGDTIPGMPLIISIAGNDKMKFTDSIVQFYNNKNVVISGRVKMFMGQPEISLYDSAQINIVPGNEIVANDSIVINPVVTPSVNIDIYDGCPPIGLTTNLKLEELNKQKNRYNYPLQSDFDSAITLNSLLIPGNDENRWNVKTAVELTGYVFEVKSGGSETCNCHVNDDVHTDTHIVLVADPTNHTGNKRVIIEITPRMRFLMAKKGIDWSTSKLKSQLVGHWVKVKGWLFFDSEHTASAENTNPGNVKNWRATAWEVHPITNIEIVNHQ